jgi:hypothetical protein
VTEGRWRLVETRLAAGSKLSFWTHPVVRAELERREPEMYRDLFGGPGWQGMLDTLEAYRGELRRIRRELNDIVVVELFDLEQDRDQEHDVAAQHPERVERLKALLEAGRERSAAARRGLASGARAVESELDLDELRALGYAGED